MTTPFNDGNPLRLAPDKLDTVLKYGLKTSRHVIEIEEPDRQAIILALAELSIARPGWVEYLESIALKMDNRTPDGRAQMFEAFRLNHSNPVASALSRE